MKTNLHIKLVSIFNLIQLHLESIDLPKIYVDRKFQKARSNRRHHSINWRWQSQLMQWNPISSP
jgi:hypothetical protein